jgi:hypothetical protein
MGFFFLQLVAGMGVIEIVISRVDSYENKLIYPARLIILPFNTIVQVY